MIKVLLTTIHHHNLVVQLSILNFLKIFHISMIINPVRGAIFSSIFYLGLRVLSLPYINQVGMKKLYQYSKVTNSYVQKSCYDIDTNNIFPVSILSRTISNVS